MRHWDLVVGASGAIAVLAFALLTAAMASPPLASYGAAAIVVFAIGVIGIVVGIFGMSHEVTVENSVLATRDDQFHVNGRLDVYRRLAAQTQASAIRAD